MDNLTQKAQLRKLMRTKLRMVSSSENERASYKLCEQLKPLLNQAKSVAIYHACNGEISLKLVIEYCLMQKIQVSAPIAVKSSKVLRFEPLINLNPQPIFVAEDYELKDEVKWYNLDLVLLPIIALDNTGVRLGQGGGYYDTSFSQAQTKNILCAVGYDWQYLAEIAHDPWDLSMNYFASEKRLVKVS